LKPKWAQHKKGKNNTTTIVQDLGLDYKDETKVTTMGIKGKSPVSSSSSCVSSAKDKVIPDCRKINELFHLNTLVDSESQVNLISDQVV
jgi:hypothetical protein